uniref:CIDE-N domain-containing protein n=1 Tax=Knipowitschia caucasica TaxID=637954 RepID=A0AAV2M2N9_KNICA
MMNQHVSVQHILPMTLYKAASAPAAADCPETETRLDPEQTETMDYASKYISLIAPSAISKSLVVAPRAKPFRVSNADRSLKKGFTAHALDELLYKVKDSLNVSPESSLVLEEDGTEIDSEDFFQTLPVNSVLMVVDKGEKWTPLLIRSCEFSEERTDVAKLTIDLYKNNPKDFIGCVNLKATLYGAYSVSYDLRCYNAKKIIKTRASSEAALRHQYFQSLGESIHFLADTASVFSLREIQLQKDPGHRTSLFQPLGRGKNRRQSIF